MKKKSLIAISCLGIIAVLAWALSLLLSAQVSPVTSTSTRNLSNATAVNANSNNAARLVSAPEGRSYPTLLQDSPLVQAAGGYTVTLYPLYADANRVELYYTVESAYADLAHLDLCQSLPGQDPPCYSSGAVALPATPLPEPTREGYEPKLADDRGQSLPWVIYPMSSVYSSTGKLPGSGLVFNRAQFSTSQPADLKLHLVLNQAQFLTSVSSLGAYVRYIKGPFTFDFSLPVDPDMSVAEVNQSITASADETLTVERVIATRHNVRVVWRSSKPLAARAAPDFLSTSYKCCLIKLNTGRQWITFGDSAYPEPDGYVITDATAFDQPGAWDLLTAYVSTYMGNAYYPNIDGPTFHFNMPGPGDVSKP